MVLRPVLKLPVLKLVTNARGVGLIEVLVASSSAALLALAIASLVSRATQAQARVNLLSSVGIVRSQFTALLQNPNAWAITSQKNKSMGCLANHTSCLGASQQGPQSFVLYGPDGSVFYDPTDKNAGFATNGSVCTTYGQSSGCNVRLDLTWQPVCTSSSVDPTCSSPTVTVQGAFSHAGVNPFNLASYNFSLNTFNGSLGMEQICIALKGNFNTATQKCVLPSACTQSTLHGNDGGGAGGGG